MTAIPLTLCSSIYEDDILSTLALTLTHMITAYSVSGNVAPERTLICVILHGFFPVINGLSPLIHEDILSRLELGIGPYG